MFQPQPTPFASTFLAAPPLYGLLDTGHDLDLHLQPPLPLSTPAGGRPGAVNVVAAAHPAGPQYASHAHYQNPHEHDAQLKLSPQTQHLQLQQKLLLLPHHPRNLHQLQHGDAHPYSPVIKMEDQDQHGLAAQQAAARDYEPVYEVRKLGDLPGTESFFRRENTVLTYHGTSGLNGWRQDEHRCYHPVIRQSRPSLRREDNSQSLQPRP